MTDKPDYDPVEAAARAKKREEEERKKREEDEKKQAEANASHMHDLMSDPAMAAAQVS